MITRQEKPDNKPGSTGIGPGERLQAARIQQGLSLQDVASRMHLSGKILEAIEENNFEEITAPIFVKGYLRAYARIVSLDEDEMILQYRDFFSEEDPPISSTSNILPELSVADARIKWTTYLVIFVIGVLLAAWWWTKEQNNETAISLGSQSSSEVRTQNDAEMVSSEIEAASEDMTATTATVEVAPESVDQVNEPITMQDSSAAESVVVEPVIEEPVTDEPLTAEPETAEPMTDEPVTAEPVSVEPVALEPGSEALATAPVVRADPIRLAPSGSDKLQINVVADTWADVKDTNGYQLVYDLLRADDSVKLTGEAPFSVFLGNGHGVEIIFNGEAIDIAPRIRDDNTARLKIR